MDSKKINGDEALAIELQKKEYAVSAPRPIHVNVAPVTHGKVGMAGTKGGTKGAESPSNTTKDDDVPSSDKIENDGNDGPVTHGKRVYVCVYVCVS